MIQILSDFAGVGFVEVDADDFGDAGFLHGDAEDDVGFAHGAFVVGDNDELGVFAHFVDEAGEAAYVGFVEGGVDFVEDAEGAGLELEDADEEGEGGEGLFAAGKQEDVLELFAGG